jgi:hypothetical protein
MRNWIKPAAGSTAQLLLFAGLYFATYTLYGLGVKFGQAPKIDGFPGLSDLEFLVYSTLGSAAVCLSVIFAAQWWRARFTAREFLFMALSGTFTALVIPTTTLMYSLPISVMVAMVIMRGSVIVITRLVDALFLWRGISPKPVRWEENCAVLISLIAVGLNLFFARAVDFDFLDSSAALWILGVYIFGYAARLLIMNYFKFTRGTAGKATNKNYFAIEQLTASFWIFGFVGLVLAGALPFGPALYQFRDVLQTPPPAWGWAVMLGMPFGFSAFFSLFLFMFQGRTSTFSGLVNRLTSLIAGTASTLLFALCFGGKWPKPVDWISFVLILAAVGFLARGELKSRHAQEAP